SRQLLAGHVLDEREQERVAIVGLAHERGHRLDTGLPRRPPAPFAGDQLVAALRPWADDDRLEQALGLDRPGEPVGRLGREATARLARVRVDLVERELRQLLRRRGETAYEDVETAAEAAAGFASAARQAPSPPSSTRPLRRSGGRTRSPGARGSAPRRGGPSVARSCRRRAARSAAAPPRRRRRRAACARPPWAARGRP